MPKGRPGKPLTDAERAAKAAAKAEKFAELAAERVGKVLDRIRMIEPLSNKATYQFEPWQVQQMYDVLNKQLDETFSRFQPSSSGAVKTGFSFSPPSTDKDEVKEAAE